MAYLIAWTDFLVNVRVLRFADKKDATAYFDAKLPENCTAHVLTSEDDFTKDAFSTSLLARLYSLIVPKAPVTKFENRAAAVHRTWMVFDTKYRNLPLTSMEAESEGKMNTEHQHTYKDHHTESTDTGTGDTGQTDTGTGDTGQTDTTAADAAKAKADQDAADKLAAAEAAKTAKEQAKAAKKLEADAKKAAADAKKAEAAAAAEAKKSEARKAKDAKAKEKADAKLAADAAKAAERQKISDGVASKRKEKATKETKPREPAGKPAAAEGKPMRPGSINARILSALMKGTFTLEKLGEEAEVPPCLAGIKVETQSRIWSIWKQNGIGYSVDQHGHYHAHLPPNLTVKNIFQEPVKAATKKAAAKVEADAAKAAKAAETASA